MQMSEITLKDQVQFWLILSNFNPRSSFYFYSNRGKKKIILFIKEQVDGCSKWHVEISSTVQSNKVSNRWN